MIVHVPLCVHVYLGLCVQVCYQSLMPWNMGVFHLMQYQTIILSSERLWGWPTFSLAEASPCTEVSAALQTPWQESGSAVPSWRELSAWYRAGSASWWPHADPAKGLWFRLGSLYSLFWIPWPADTAVFGRKMKQNTMVGTCGRAKQSLSPATGKTRRNKEQLPGTYSSPTSSN